MARLHTETIPTSTLASTARVVDGFVTTQTDHQGITSSSTLASTATGITQTATDGRGNTTTTHTDLAGRSYSEDKAPDGCKGDWTNAPHLPEGRGAVGRLRVNICELFGSDGYIKTAYTYTPYGSVTANGNVTQSPRRLVGGLDKCAAFAPKGRGRNGVRTSQPIQWSSEYNDTELGLVYYNYRHYNPADGRWTGRDLVSEEFLYNLYQYVNPIFSWDTLGLFCSDKKEHGKISPVSSLVLTFQHAGGLEDMDMVISDPDTLFRKKINDYVEGVVYETTTNMAKRRWPGVVRIGKDLIEKYQKLKGDLAWYIRWFTTIGTLYT